MATEHTTQSILDNVAAGLDHFSPSQGFIDDEKPLNLRYGFRLGKINFLVNKFTMCEVVKRPVIYSIPNTPSWVQGLINLHGVLVPVFNIKNILNNKHNVDKKNDPLLVIDKDERAFATFIDALPDSINIDDTDFTETTIPDDIPEIMKKYTTDAFKLNQEIWLELNYDSFIKNLTKNYSRHQARNKEIL